MSSFFLYNVTVSPLFLIFCYTVTGFNPVDSSVNYESNCRSGEDDSDSGAYGRDNESG